VRILDVDPVPLAEAGVDVAYVSPTGTILFTPLRLLLVTREHLLEEKVETASWPYRAIRHFAIQEGADGRASLRIWLAEEAQPLHLRARPDVDLRPLARLLAERLR
jgi:hypothetical protein